MASAMTAGAAVMGMRASVAAHRPPGLSAGRPRAFTGTINSANTIVGRHAYGVGATAPGLTAL
ncbi:MAG TPA: hypothetical protein VFS48_01165 [Solirubrobacterales bacterium]|nr:hypothetical protein [Solirubrobacterales bacterium]